MKYLCLFLLIGIQCIAQSKKSYFFDENWRQISEQSFKKMEADRSKILTYIDVDTAYVGKTYLYENYGKLEPSVFVTIKKHLQNLSGKPIDQNKTIVINYVSDITDPKVTEGGRPYVYDFSDWKEQKKLMKREDINLLWIQHPNNKSYIKQYRRKINWLYDEGDFIPKAFLEYNCVMGSFIVINPDGSYLAYYCIEGAFDQLNNLVDQMKKTE